MGGRFLVLATFHGGMQQGGTPKGNVQVIWGLHQTDGRLLCEGPSQLCCDKLASPGDAVPAKAVGCLHSSLAGLPTSISLHS